MEAGPTVRPQTGRLKSLRLSANLPSYQPFHAGTGGLNLTAYDVPTALWFLPNPLILENLSSFGVKSNEFGFIISWATNIPVVVEARTNLDDTTWTPVSTNTLTNGSSYFSDAQWTNYPGRFYRLRSP